MKKLSILFTAAMLVMGMSFASCSKTSGSKMKTAVDSLSYAYGVGMGTNLAQNLQQFPAKINVELFLAVFEKALKGDTTKLAISPQQAYEVFQRCLATAQKEAAVAVKEDAKKFLEKNAKADGVKTTPSGLQYTVIKEGNGPKPVDTATVSVHYHGTLLDGTVFDSSVDRGTPAEFPLNRVIKGWTEGIQLMNVGSKYKFWIPADLGYGDNGAGAQIKPGSLLIFEVELLGIKGITPEPATPTVAPAAPTK
ncbi:MAG: FKBP-type peptidyl-prolyl cis-trans isomerase [Bacteroidia bacterium]|nr:FKBP-type peptidyl-prolyl cis-trans isomerase [Bacteroidia bacterium]